MNINIKTIHFTAKQELTDFITEKVGALFRYSDEILAGEVSLKLDKSATRENKICEIRLVVPGNDLFAKRQCETFEGATKQTIEALQKQIEKLKWKLKSIK
ncbi:MAG: ribosome-associated translation inhibitor RaiA [Chitinophagales bacterium]|nr:ribosome-associated translation inhibitor RaiA [Chitinophagales bacterium]